MKEFILVGTPNAGKTTLFNWMTGRRQKVVNYPGSTVDYIVGDVLASLGKDIKVFDSPGTYSLFPKSPEEDVTLKLLRREGQGFSGIIVVVDSTQIERQAVLVEQLKELGLPIVVAMTMWDLHLRDGKNLPVKELSEFLKVPVVPVDGRLGGGVKALIEQLEKFSAPVKANQVSKWGIEKYQSIFQESARFINSILSPEISARKRTEVVDRLILHPVFGPGVFLLTMSLVFSSIFWLAAPLMDLVDGGFSFLGEMISGVSWAPLLKEFLADGIVGSMGAVLVFVPQIFILFVAISLLEDSGYLSRAAAIVDKPLSYFGLNGRSFVPMLSGFACAVPAIMAARTITSPKARWLTVFILPLMTCSARLPVYALLLAFLFFGKSSVTAGFALAGLYLGAVVLGLVASKILSLFVKTTGSEFFMMELPLYRMPRPATVLMNSLRRTKQYVIKSGPIIFVMAVLIWVSSTFPRFDLEGTQRLEASYLGQVGQVLEPMFKPMGADWRIGISLISAFAAREVFVSSLAVVMNISGVEDADADSVQESLLTNMQSAKTLDDGRQLFSLASVVALLVFFMIALQCTSTVGVVIREMGSWKYGIAQLVGMNFVAYLGAVSVFQILRAMGLDT